MSRIRVSSAIVLFLIALLTLLPGLAPLQGATAQDAASAIPTAPAPPAEGPGSDAILSYPGASFETVGGEGNQYLLWRPASDAEGGTPAAAGPFPLVIFFGECCDPYPWANSALATDWMTYLARQGYVVAAPIYNFEDQLTTVQAVTQAMLSDLGLDPTIDLERVAVIGHSIGVPLAMIYASMAADYKWPQPSSLFLSGPCIGDFCSELPPGMMYPEGMKALVLSYESHDNMRNPLGAYTALDSLPNADRGFVQMFDDAHGFPAVNTFQGPGIIGDSESPGFRWGNWKLSSALLACGFTGEWCEYALGNTPEQMSMGAWSDGVPVEPLRDMSGLAVNAFSSYSGTPVAVDPAAGAGTSADRGNNARTGEVDFAGPAGNPVVKWQANLPSQILVQPTASDGLAFFTTFAGVYALDLDDGSAVWSKELAGWGSSPVLDNGTIYVGTDGDGLFALDAATGAELWHYLPQEPVEMDPPHNLIDSSPLVQDGVVYLSPGPWGNVYAVDAATGVEKWVFEIQGGMSFLSAYADGSLYVAYDHLDDAYGDAGEPVSGIVAIDAVTGAEKWRYEAEPGWIGHSNVLVHNGLVVAGFNSPLFGTGAWFALDAATGSKLWTQPGHWTDENWLAASDGVLILPFTNNSGVFGIDIATGEVLWTQDINMRTWSGSVIADGIAYLHDRYGLVHAYDVSTGGEYWQFETAEGAFTADPVVGASPGLLLAAVGNQIWAVEGDGATLTASPPRTVNPPAPVVAEGAATSMVQTGELTPPEPFGPVQSVAIAPDGRIYVVDAYSEAISVFAEEGTYLEGLELPSEAGGPFRFNFGAWGLGNINIGDDGTIYVTDTFNQRIVVLDGDHNLIRTIDGVAIASGVGIDDANGRIYVSDLSSGLLHVFDKEGNLLDRWGMYGAGDQTRIRWSTGVAVGKDGEVFVPAFSTNMIRTFSPDGTPLRILAGFGDEPGRPIIPPWGITTDVEGNILVGAGYCAISDAVMYSPDGTVTNIIDQDEAMLNCSPQAARAADGKVYVAAEGNNAVYIYEPAAAAGGATPEAGATPESG